MNNNNLKVVPKRQKRNATESIETLQVESNNNAELLMEIKNISKEVSELKCSVQYMSDKYDEILAQWKAESEDNKALRVEVQQLTHENAELQARVESIEHDWNTSKQESIRNNIVIFGISASDANNNTEDIVDKLLLKVNIPKDAVKNILHHNDHNNQPGALMISFIDNNAKNTFLKLAKRLDIKPNDLGLSTSGRISFNEQLTRMNQTLLQETRQLRSHGFKFIWSKNGRILVRKTATSKIMAIHNIHCIEALKSPNVTLP